MGGCGWEERPAAEARAMGPIGHGSWQQEGKQGLMQLHLPQGCLFYHHYHICSKQQLCSCTCPTSSTTGPGIAPCHISCCWCCHLPCAGARAAICFGLEPLLPLSHALHWSSHCLPQAASSLKGALWCSTLEHEVDPTSLERMNKYII